MKKIECHITKDGLEEVIKLDPNSEDFDDEFGNFLCELFDATAVDYNIKIKA